MNTEEIIEMARQVGIAFPSGEYSDIWQTYIHISKQEIKAFAKLVAAKATDEANARSNTSWTLMCKKMVENEREACAKVADGWPDYDVEGLAEAIRART